MALVPIPFRGRRIGPTGHVLVASDARSRVYIYEHDTDTEVEVYETEAGGTPVEQPIRADSEGKYDYWIEGNTIYDSYSPVDGETEPFAAPSGGAVSADGATEEYVDDAVAAGLSLAYAYSDSADDVETISGNYTLVLADAQKMKEQTSGSASTFTVPPNASVAFDIGTVVSVTRAGTGTVTVTPGSGVTIRSPGALLDLTSQWSQATLYKRGTNEWVLSGDLS